MPWYFIHKTHLPAPEQHEESRPGAGLASQNIFEGSSCGKLALELTHIRWFEPKRLELRPNDLAGYFHAPSGIVSRFELLPPQCQRPAPRIGLWRFRDYGKRLFGAVHQIAGDVLALTPSNRL
jgi:hypothetical protein